MFTRKTYYFVIFFFLLQPFWCPPAFAVEDIKGSNTNAPQTPLPKKVGANPKAAQDEKAFNDNPVGRIKIEEKRASEAGVALKQWGAKAKKNFLELVFSPDVTFGGSLPAFMASRKNADLEKKFNTFIGSNPKLKSTVSRGLAFREKYIKIVGQGLQGEYLRLFMHYDQEVLRSFLSEKNLRSPKKRKD